MSNGTAGTTAFVLAGGGSFGAIQVGMLRELVAHGVKPDLWWVHRWALSTVHISPVIQLLRA
jgi:hypothetical protein